MVIDGRCFVMTECGRCGGVGEGTKGSVSLHDQGGYDRKGRIAAFSLVDCLLLIQRNSKMVSFPFHSQLSKDMDIINWEWLGRVGWFWSGLVWSLPLNDWTMAWHGHLQGYPAH